MKVKDSRETRYQKSLPPQFAKDAFWTTNHATFPTSFGSNPREVNVFPSDDPYQSEQSFDHWEGTDKNYSNHGRLPIESTWGRFQFPPSPVKYNPIHEKLSRRENDPARSILDKHNQKEEEYYAAVQIAQTYKSPEFMIALETKKLNKAHTLLKKSANVSTIKEITKLKNPPSELQKVNIEDMRKSLLPGPCSYQVEGKLDLLDRYERQPQALLRPRHRVGNPRLVLNRETLELRTDDSTLINAIGSYYPKVDLLHKHNPAFTLGEIRPIIQQKQELCPGPGDYCQDEIMRIGSARLISTKDHLQKTKLIPVFPSKSFASAKYRKKTMF